MLMIKAGQCLLPLVLAQCSIIAHSTKVPEREVMEIVVDEEIINELEAGE